MRVRELSGLLAGTAALALLVPGEARAQTTFTPPTLITSERGLSEPVPPMPDVAALNLQEAIDTAAALNTQFLPGCRWTASGTTVTAILPFAPGTAGCGVTGFAIAAFEHRVFTTEIASLIDNRAGTSSDVELTGVLARGAQVTLRGQTVAGTRPGLLRAARSADGRRYFGGAEVQTGGGPFVVTDRVLSELLTGRDTYTGLAVTIGSGNDRAFGIGTATAGTRVGCTAPASTAGCVGGITVELPFEKALFVAEIYTTLFITTSIERTLTGGTTFYDLALTPLPAGAVHAAAANAGFVVTDRFLRRMTDGPVVPDGGAFWSEAWGSQSRFDSAGVLGATDIDSFGFAGGFVLNPGEDWTLGLAGEYGESDLAIADALTPESADASHLEVGAHASFASGRFHAGAAAMVGLFDIETTGVSALGAARAGYDATIAGAAIESGYDLPVGALTLTPAVGASVLSWSRGAFAEAGGPAPLTVAGADETQTRLWAGLKARWAPDAGGGRLAVSGYARAASISGDRVARVTTFDPQLPGEPFVVAGPDFGDSVAELGVALDYRLGGRTRIEAGYDARFGSGHDGRAGFVRLAVEW